MTIRLRAHHLLCLLTYVGKGYSPAFTANYDAIAERLSRGEDILLVSGPDDICAPLLDEPEPHCLNEGVIERDRLAARDEGKAGDEARDTRDSKLGPTHEHTWWPLYRETATPLKNSRISRPRPTAAGRTRLRSQGGGVVDSKRSQGK